MVGSDSESEITKDRPASGKMTKSSYRPVYLSPLFLAPVRRPVLRAAMRPTLRPAEVSRRTVEAIPMCLWLPPPWGCSTGFMATPRTLGQQFLFTLYLWYALPALRMGLSIPPPPATMPTVARLAEGITLLEPDGIFTLVLLVSGLWAMTMA